MLISRRLITNFINLDSISNVEIIEALNNCGFETSIIHNYQELNQKLKVVKILSKNKHSVLNRLNICQVHNGDKTLSIVCGADNFQIGDKVILAPVGITLNNNIMIKKRKFIDVYSEGMLCSWPELGFNNQNKNQKEIAILPNKAKEGTKPLNYVFLNDCLFDVKHPLNQKKSGTVFIIAQYLAKYFNIPFLKQKTINYHSIITSKKTQNNFIGFASVTFQNKKNSPQWLKSQLSLHQKNITDNIFFDLATYVALETGVKNEIVLNTSPLTIKEKKEINSPFITKRKLLKHSKTTNCLDIYSISGEQNNQKLMPFFTHLAHQRYLSLLKKEMDLSVINIDNWESKLSELTQQTQKIEIDYINRILGTNFTFLELKKIFQNTEFELILQKPKTIKFILPKYHYWKNDNEIISEIIKFYNINKIPEKFFAIQENNYNINPTTNFLSKINKYLLNLGLQRVKTFSLQKRQISPDPTIIYLETKKEHQQLSKSLIDNLNDVNLTNSNNIFTIDKTFFQQQKKFIEELKLGIIWKNCWINNSLAQEKIKINENFLILIVQNILNILTLDSQKLFKTVPNIVKNNSEIPVYSSNNFFNSQSFEDLYYHNTNIGQIGMLNAKLSQKINNGFYLELNLSQLFQLIPNPVQKLVFKETNIDKRLIYQDFSFEIEGVWTPKVYLPLKNKKILELNFFEYIIEQIQSCDDKIIKMELIDFYQKQKFTFRIWKNKDLQNKEKESYLFHKLEKKLKSLKNVKIFEKEKKK